MFRFARITLIASLAALVLAAVCDLAVAQPGLVVEDRAEDLAGDVGGRAGDELAAGWVNLFP